MVLDSLGTSLKNTLKKLASAVFVDDKLVNELVKDIQRALLQADVNVKLVLALSHSIKDRITAEKTASGLTKKEHLINIVYEELVKLLGGEHATFKIDDEKKPYKILLLGLFGSGKTTTAGKLAKYFVNRGKRVAVVGLDTFRPAAMEQLLQNAKRAGITAFINKTEKDPVKIYKQFEKEYAKFDILIVDTAGRDALNEELTEEIERIDEIVDADSKLLVISGDIGQAAQTQAEKFHKTCGVTGVIATKMDGTAKAGGALSACAVTNAPILFIGVGEMIDDLEAFNAKGFVGRLLGMGDLEALLEKAKLAMSEDEAKDVSKKFMKGDFSLKDLYSQMEAMSKMGSMQKLMEMIPGMGQLHIPKEALSVQEGKLKRWKYIMNSCTPYELEHPEDIDAKRMERIAKGSGSSMGEVRELLKQHKQAKKMMKMLKADSPEKMMKNFQKGGMQKMLRK